MESRDFIVVPDTATVGDAFRTLLEAKANVNWHVVVKYTDHYSGIQAGKLAQTVVGRGTQIALEVALRELAIPALPVVPRSPGNLGQIRQPALVLENDRPIAIAYEPMRGSFTDMMNAKLAFDQLASAVATSVIPTTDFVAVPAAATVKDAFNTLLDVKGNVNWYVIVRYADHYGAIQAGKLAQAVIGRGAQAALKMSLREVDISAISTVAQGEASAPSRIRQLTLVLENDLPALVYQTYRLDLNSTQDAFERLTVGARTRSAAKARPSAPPTNTEDWDTGDMSLTVSARPKSPESTPPDKTAGPPSPTPEKTDARARYVNTWFTDRVGGDAFIRERTLARKRRCWVQLHIGPLLRESIIVAPRPIDPDLPPIPDEGLLLRIKLFSRDFEIEQDTAELRLFKTGATERLHLAVTPRAVTRDARLRIGIYYQNNLAQSILLHARVDEKENKLGRGDRANWAEVEYSLSEDWADVTQLQPRPVSVFVNDSSDGTHMVGVVGTRTEGALDIGRDKMTEAVTEFRAKLLGIIMDDQKRYRYHPDNSGDPDKFIDDLKTLAYVGNALFRSVFYRDETIDFTRELRQALANTQSAVIQIARLSSDFVFPWAGIYDRRLEIDRDKNQVCLEPLKQSTPEAALAACSTCSHGEDRNVICLSGFWGFRHIVEQPLGVVKKDKKPISVVREIKASGKLKTSINVYVGDDFKLRVSHQDWLVNQVKQKNSVPILADELKEVKEGLRQSQHLCYFYCHGGSDPKSLNPWLTVGKDERLMPSDLYSLGLEEDWRFNNVRPLVFINACHSMEFTPEALSAFLPELTTAGASGIIGTEISIYEPLAVEFGQGLIQAFLNGEPIGKAVQKLRWQLLLKRNVLGLVYTPYCYADLKLVA